MNGRGLLIVMLLATAAAGCERQPPARDAAVDADVDLDGDHHPDADVDDDPDADVDPPTELVYEPGAAPGGPTVRLELGEAAGGRLRFDVVTEGEPEIFGLAFRVTCGPATLEFAELLPNRGAWSAVAAAQEVRPGELWVVVSAKGSSDGVPVGRHVWATLAFEQRGLVSTQLAFVADRSVALGIDGAPQRLDWIGGELVAR